MDIVGHQKIIDFLKNSIKNKRLSQSYLFCGPEHIGKKTTAIYFAASLLCSSQNFPCQQCEHCRQVFQGEHPDVYCVGKIEDKEISIDQIREIKNVINLTPLSGSSKIVIIEEADSLTISAVNSLLKLLEETPPHVFIILLTKGFNNLPTTLRSRCQILRFLLPTSSELSCFLKKEFSLSLVDVKRISDLSLGLPGIAIELAQNKEGIFKYREDLMEKFAFFLSERNKIENKFKLANLILKSQTRQNLFFLLQFIRDLALVKLKLNPSGVLEKKELLDLSKKYSKIELYLFINQILKTQIWLTKHVNQKLSIENLVLNDFV